MKRSSLALAFLALLTLLSSSPAPAQGGPQRGLPAERASFQAPKSRPAFAPGRVLVRFRKGRTPATMAAAHAAVRGQAIRSYRVVDGLQLVRLAAGMSVAQALRLYRRNPDVLYAEPDYRVHILAPVIPNDPQFHTQWELNNTGQSGGRVDADIDAPEAWRLTAGSNSVTVGVIDTGFDYNHEDLAANVWSSPFSYTVNGVTCPVNSHGFNVAYNTCDPMDDNGHGTHVSGTIGAKGNNHIGVAGVNWNVTLIACKFLDASGNGYDSDAVTCLEFFKDLKDNHAINVVATNNSWGGYWFSQALFDAIDGHRQSGILLVAAAGNYAVDNDGPVVFPADYYLPNLIAVASTDRNDLLSEFSDYGKRTVHLGAPGSEILSTTPNNTYSTFSGTSMAAPHVTGVAALLKAQDPSRDWRALKNLILAGGDSKASLTNTVTSKRLNANGSLTCSNSEVMGRLQPVGDSPSVVVGLPATLAVLHINCASPAGDVTVTINPGGLTLTLKDDGVGPDQAAGDGIYTGQFTPAALGRYTVGVTGGETFTLTALLPYSYQPTTYSYRTITGTNLAFVMDQAAQITPSFPVRFGGASFSSLWVSSNGTISFDIPFASWNNTGLPTPGPNTLVAPFWTSFAEADCPAACTSPDPDQNVFWQEIGTAPSRELVVEWRDVYLPWVPGPDGWDQPFPDESVRFQVVFFEGKSDILFNYADATFGGYSAFADHGATATVGVQVTHYFANQFSFAEPRLTDNMSLLWRTAPGFFMTYCGSPTLICDQKGCHWTARPCTRPLPVIE